MALASLSVEPTVPESRHHISEIAIQRNFTVLKITGRLVFETILSRNYDNFWKTSRVLKTPGQPMLIINLAKVSEYQIRK